MLARDLVSQLKEQMDESDFTDFVQAAMRSLGRGDLPCDRCCDWNMRDAVDDARAEGYEAGLEDGRREEPKKPPKPKPEKRRKQLRLFRLDEE